jgi:hypothetical protein
VIAKLKARWVCYCTDRAIDHLAELARYQRAVTLAMRTGRVHDACTASREADWHRRQAIAWQDRAEWGRLNPR